jgi:hypothetical protein
MVVGMSLAAFTMLHVIISLIAIASGLIVVFGMLGSNRMKGLTALFLLSTILTSVTGFMFPFNGFLPSHAFGILSLLLLVAVLPALYKFQLAGNWRWIYVVGAVILLYLNVFVLVFQVFLKIPFFNALAPTQAEPPFAIAQGLALLVFIVLGVLAVKKFHPQ